VWQPSALKLIKSNVTRKIIPEIERLGPLAPELTARKLVNEIYRRSVVAWDARIAETALSAFPKAPPKEAFGSFEWMAAQADYEEKFRQGIDSGFVFSHYLAVALSALKSAFADKQSPSARSHQREEDSLRLARFQHAFNAFHRIFVDTFNARMAIEGPKVAAMATHGATASAVGGWILSSCVLPAFVAISKVRPEDDLLKEDPETTAKRQSLLAFAVNSAHALDVVGRIHSTLGPRRVPITRWHCGACGNRFTARSGVAIQPAGSSRPATARGGSSSTGTPACPQCHRAAPCVPEAADTGEDEEEGSGGGEDEEEEEEEED
jgi:hypothetical protein